MSANKKNAGTVGTDAGEAPEREDRFRERLAKRRGRHLVGSDLGDAEGGKQRIALRFDKDVLAAFRTGEPGWQLRLNKALKVFLKEHNPRDL